MRTSSVQVMYHVEGVKDIGRSLNQARIWFRLGRRSIETSFKRTALGPFWLVLDQALWAFLFAALSSWFFGGGFQERLGYVGVGLFGWTTSISFVNASSTVFLHNVGLLHLPIARSQAVFLEAFKQLFLALFRYVGLLTILSLFGEIRFQGLIFLPIYFAGIMIWGGGILMVLGPVTTRWRDVEPILNLITRFSLLLTPVFWHLDDVSAPKHLSAISRFNPLASHIEILRAINLGQIPNSFDVYTFFGWSAFSVLLGVAVFSVTIRRIAYWV